MASTPNTGTRWNVIRDEIRDELLAVDSVRLVHDRIRFDNKLNRNQERLRCVAFVLFERTIAQLCLTNKSSHINCSMPI